MQRAGRLERLLAGVLPVQVLERVDVVRPGRGLVDGDERRFAARRDAARRDPRREHLRGRAGSSGCVHTG